MLQVVAGPAVLGATTGGDVGVSITFGGPALEQGSDPLAPQLDPVGDGSTPLPPVSLQIHLNENFFIMLRKLFKIIGFHMQRAFMWKLTDIKYTDYEAKSIVNQKEEQSMPNRQQIFNVWRRSVIFVTLPAVGIRIILSLVVIFRSSIRDYFNSFGIMILLGYVFGLILDGVSICTSLWFWNSYEKSSRYLAIGWIGSMFLSLSLITFPVSFILKDDIFDQSDAKADIYVRWAFGMSFIILILPILITVPISVIRGSLYIKGLLPEASLPGFFIALVSPLAALLILVSALIMSELTGDPLSFIGIILQILAPLIMAFRSRLYTAPRTEKIDAEISWIHWITEGMVSLGLLCLIIWAANKKLLSDGTEVARFLLELFGRSLITSVFFADRLFDLSRFQLFSSRKAIGGFDWTEMEALMEYYNERYSDIKLTEKDKNHLEDYTERDENLPIPVMRKWHSFSGSK